MQKNAVAVFGGRHPRPGDSEYEEARKLGRLLAEAGYAVMNGGYIGIMEAVSRGAREAGGHAIGVTMEIFGDMAPNPFLTQEIRTRDFFERLHVLISGAQAFIVFRGGMGTVTELSLAWNMLQTSVMPPKPLILVGEFWHAVLDTLSENLVIPPTDVNLRIVVPSAEEAVRHLRERSAPLL